jgi:hypothetical protein
LLGRAGLPPGVHLLGEGGMDELAGWMRRTGQEEAFKRAILRIG